SFVFDIGSFCTFFFQAEDGIRDFHVTGVQTCALPIYPLALGDVLDNADDCGLAADLDGRTEDLDVDDGAVLAAAAALVAHRAVEIGRASCRESVWGPGVGASLIIYARQLRVSVSTFTE